MLFFQVVETTVREPLHVEPLPPNTTFSRNLQQTNSRKIPAKSTGLVEPIQEDFGLLLAKEMLILP